MQKNSTSLPPPHPLLAHISSDPMQYSSMRYDEQEIMRKRLSGGSLKEVEKMMLRMKMIRNCVGGRIGRVTEETGLMSKKIS